MNNVLSAIVEVPSACSILWWPCSSNKLVENFRGTPYILKTVLKGSLIMSHRHIFHTVPLSEMDNDQLRSYLHPQQPVRSENSSYVIPPESMATTSIVATRPTEFPSWVSSSYLSPHLAPPASLVVPPMLQLAPGASNQVPLSYSQHEIPCYSRDEAGSSNSHSHLEREHLRRKRPAVPPSSIHSSNYSMSGSSHIQNSEYLHNKPMPGSEIQPWDSMIPDYRSGRLLIPGEGSRRNVRRRHNVQIEPSLPGSQVPSSLPGYVSFPTADLPGPSMNGHWNHNSIPATPHVALPSAAPGRFSVDINQPIFGNTNTAAGYASGVPPPGYVTVPFPVHHIHGRGIAGSQNNSVQRSANYRPPPSFSSFDNAATSSEAVPRHSRPLFIGEPRGTERSGRTRYSRFQSLPPEFMGHGRWTPEAWVALDRSVIYDSRNLLDQHHDMRLDIDNMSYEELLALEERIGTVNTGLTDETLPKYLKETIYCSPDQVEDEEEVNCAICLESYKDGNELGMLKCGHDYHMTCVKKWLLIKNACPICKSPAGEK